MLRRPHYLTLGLVVLLTLLVLNLPDRTTARLKLGIGSIFLPLFGLANTAQQSAEQAAGRLLPRRMLLEQNRRLTRENEQLRLQAMQAAEIDRENARLRQMVGWQRQQPWKLKLANVVLRDPANWWRTVHIDLGARDGLTNDLPVLTPEGLVGRVSSVSLTRAQVVLLGDPNCKVAARVVNPTRDLGVIESSGPLDIDLVEMGYLPRNAAAKPGDAVVTSGEGGIFPKGIPIGTIVEVQSVEYGLAKAARVKLAVNLNALEQVWVMFPRNP